MFQELRLHSSVRWSDEPALHQILVAHVDEGPRDRVDGQLAARDALRRHEVVQLVLTKSPPPAAAAKKRHQPATGSG